MIYEYTTIDKSEWPRGPWDDEPDKRQWFDEETGLWCLLLRPAHIGYLSGYVFVPGEALPDDPEEKLSVHGGITYQGTQGEFPSFVDWHRFRRRMWHIQPETAKYPVGDSARDWQRYGRYMDDWQGWIDHELKTSIFLEDVDGPAVVCGFDCGHSGDLSPVLEMHRRQTNPVFDGALSWDYAANDVYRDINYVTAECLSLAQQLRKEFPDGRRFDDQECRRNH